MSAVIRGAKGGSAPHTPVESADNLRSISFFRILDLVSEGEIGGLVNGQQSIFLDETPLGNDDGTSNFPKAHIEQRTGTQDQDAIPGFDAVENEISVGVELTSASAWLHSVSDTTLSALRVTLSVPALSKANTSNGDITGYSIAYKIEISTDGGAFAVAYNGSFTGKTTTKFQRSHRLDLPTATTGWQVRVTRLTANAHSSAIADTTTVDSYTEIVDAKLRYPNSAVIGVMGDASQFSNIPQRAYDLWGRIVKVPSNYDVTTRTYTGVWDGTFKPSWTDNPAWIFYDLVTHSRYGLGHLVAAAQVDKWELYRIGQYCDGMVSDGSDGTEPRLTCNIYLQTQADAYKLLNDLSSAFRGISYWANGAIVASADMPADPVYTYTDANVIEGKFSYSASARKTRYTTALVSWNDPRNFYRTKVEYVEDRDGIARYGIQQTEVTAVGCASQGQAQRLGRWILLTSRYETDTVTFSVGLDGTLAAPGQIIRIADSARAGKRQGGRVHSSTTTVVTVDKAPTVAIGDTLTVIMSDGVSQTRTVSGVSGAVITVSTAFTEAPAAQAMWVVESTALAAQTFRVLSVTEDKSDADISFTLTCLQHNASKFDAVDTGTIIQVPPISALKVTNQPGPTAVSLTSTQVVGAVGTYSLMSIAWTAVAGAVSYEGAWRKDNGEWQPIGGALSGLSVDIAGTGAGDYTARIRAKGTGNAYSLFTLSNPFTIADNSALPTDVAAIGAGAAAAQADADAANAALADIASDNILSPVEKPVVIRDTNVITTEQAGIDAQATAYGVVAPKTAYDTAVTALATYLGTLTVPVLWNDLSGNTTIVGATFRSKFADVYTTRQTLLNAIYAAAKGLADAAQTTANAANSNVPAVINGQLKNGTVGWTFDNPTGFYQEVGANSPDSACGTYLVRQGQAGGATTYARNLGYASVVPGQTVTVTCCIEAFTANAGAYAGCRISWRDASHAEVGASLAQVTVGPGGTYLQAVSKAIGQAPSTAQFAHFELYYVNHSSGYLNATSCGLALLPANQDEVPDGTTYARTQAFTLQNGVVVPFGDGDNLIPNHSFANNDSASPAGARAIGQSVCDGWVVGLLDSAYMAVLYEQSNPDVLLRLLQGVTVPASTTIRARVYGTRKIPVTGSETLYLAFSGGRSANQTYPAGVTLTAFGGLHIYNAAGTPITDLGISFDKTVTSGTTKFGSITLPSTAAYAVPMVEVTHTTGGTAFNTSAGLYADVRISDLQIVRQLALETVGSGRRLGDMRNQVMVGVGNYGAGWSGGAITYSATSTSATITAAAATLRIGSSSLAYSAANVTVSGSAGLVRTYYLYYDDDGYTGGSKALNATTSQITSMSADGRILVGTVTVTFPTSGTGGGGGGVGCPVRTARVVRRVQGGEQDIEAGVVVVGDRLKIIDPVTGATRWGLVTMSKPAYVDCVRVAQRGGITLSCSITAPLGGPDGVAVLAPESLGRPVTGLDGGALVREDIVHVASIGKCWVQHITCEDDFFLAGDQPGRYLAHHNLKPLNP